MLPTTKKVARTPASSSMSSTLWVVATTVGVGGIVSPVSRRCINWCQSSRSIVSAWVATAHHPTTEQTRTGTPSTLPCGPHKATSFHHPVFDHLVASPHADRTVTHPPAEHTAAPNDHMLLARTGPCTVYRVSRRDLLADVRWPHRRGSASRIFGARPGPRRRSTPCFGPRRARRRRLPVAAPASRRGRPNA